MGRTFSAAFAVARSSALVVACVASFSCFSSLLSGVAYAEELLPTSLESIQQWSTYGAPELAIYAHTGKGNSSSTAITGPRVNPPNQQFGDLGTLVSDPERSRESITAILIGGTFGVLTPAIDVPLRPRAFAELNISQPLTTESQLARRGNPGQFGFPRGANPPSPVGEGAMIGIGTQISVQHQGPQIHAGLGVSFEFPISSDELIRIKPAAQYSRTILDIEAQTIRAVRLNQDSGVNQDLSDFRLISLRDSRTEVYHSAGPSLEIEYLPNLQWGPFTFSFFARGHAAYTFNTLKTEMEQCNVAGGQPGECARWKYTQDPWAYRATLGFHLNWAPRSFW